MNAIRTQIADGLYAYRKQDHDLKDINGMAGTYAIPTRNNDMTLDYISDATDSAEAGLEAIGMDGTLGYFVVVDGWAIPMSDVYAMYEKNDTSWSHEIQVKVTLELDV